VPKDEGLNPRSVAAAAQAGGLGVGWPPVGGAFASEARAGLPFRVRLNCVEHIRQ